MPFTRWRHFITLLSDCGYPRAVPSLEQDLTILFDINILECNAATNLTNVWILLLYSKFRGERASEKKTLKIGQYLIVMRNTWRRFLTPGINCRRESKGKGPILAVALLERETCPKRFTSSAVAADWHELTNRRALCCRS